MTAITYEGTGWLLAWILAASLALFGHGCGASPLRVHASAASVAGAIADQGCQEVRLARAEAVQDAADAQIYREDAALAVEATRTTWEPRLAACDLVREVHDTWVDGLTLASLDQSFTWADGIPFVVHFLNAYEDLRLVLVSSGVSLPELPTIVLSLAAGAHP